MIFFLSSVANWLFLVVFGDKGFFWQFFGEQQQKNSVKLSVQFLLKPLLILLAHEQCRKQSHKKQWPTISIWKRKKHDKNQNKNAVLQTSAQFYMSLSILDNVLVFFIDHFLRLRIRNVFHQKSFLLLVPCSKNNYEILVKTQMHKRKRITLERKLNF